MSDRRKQVLASPVSFKYTKRQSAARSSPSPIRGVYRERAAGSSISLVHTTTVSRARRHVLYKNRNTAAVYQVLLYKNKNHDTGTVIGYIICYAWNRRCVLSTEDEWRAALAICLDSWSEALSVVLDIDLCKWCPKHYSGRSSCTGSSSSDC